MRKTLFGILCSIIYSYILLPTKEGEEPSISPTLYPFIYKGMIILPFSNSKAIHLHHWIIYMIICLSSLYIHIPKFIYGFSFGLCIQGLLYNDWYQIICDNPYNSR
jgi:hypothetical protein